jgi:hypothetical protein
MPTQTPLSIGRTKNECSSILLNNQEALSHKMVAGSSRRNGNPNIRELLKMMRLAYISTALSLLVFLAAGLLGCGGDSDTSDAPTKVVYITRADAICRKADSKQEDGLHAYAKKHEIATLSTAQQEDLIVAVGIPPLRTEVEELGELTPPDGDEEAEAIITEMEEAVAKAEEDPNSMTNEASSPFVKVDQRAAKYGFKDCSDAL